MPSTLKEQLQEQEAFESNATDAPSALKAIERASERAIERTIESNAPNVLSALR